MMPSSPLPVLSPSASFSCGGTAPRRATASAAALLCVLLPLLRQIRNVYRLPSTPPRRGGKELVNSPWTRRPPQLSQYHSADESVVPAPSEQGRRHAVPGLSRRDEVRYALEHGAVGDRVWTGTDTPPGRGRGGLAASPKGRHGYLQCPFPFVRVRVVRREGTSVEDGVVARHGVVAIAPVTLATFIAGLYGAGFSVKFDHRVQKGPRFRGLARFVRLGPRVQGRGEADDVWPNFGLISPTLVRRFVDHAPQNLVGLDGRFGEPGLGPRLEEGIVRTDVGRGAASVRLESGKDLPRAAGSVRVGRRRGGEGVDDRVVGDDVWAEVLGVVVLGVTFGHRRLSTQALHTIQQFDGLGARPRVAGTGPSVDHGVECDGVGPDGGPLGEHLGQDGLGLLGRLGPPAAPGPRRDDRRVRVGRGTDGRARSLLLRVRFTARVPQFLHPRQDPFGTLGPLPRIAAGPRVQHRVARGRGGEDNFATWHGKVCRRHPRRVLGLVHHAEEYPLGPHRGVPVLRSCPRVNDGRVCLGVRPHPGNAVLPLLCIRRRFRRRRGSLPHGVQNILGPLRRVPPPGLGVRAHERIVHRSVGTVRQIPRLPRQMLETIDVLPRAGRGRSADGGIRRTYHRLDVADHHVPQLSDLTAGAGPLLRALLLLRGRRRSLGGLLGRRGRGRNDADRLLGVAVVAADVRRVGDGHDEQRAGQTVGRAAAVVVPPKVAASRPRGGGGSDSGGKPNHRCKPHTYKPHRPHPTDEGEVVPPPSSQCCGAAAIAPANRTTRRRARVYDVRISRATDPILKAAAAPCPLVH
mmetsp:Transcript_54946/g.164577  ORF Transcript_54946/g.164577 Transcript_54946/m.164577 type:complete len:803 (+) Transcript_54946:246-2654(+)